MVLPLGPMDGAQGMPLEMTAPRDVKDRFAKYWWAFYFLMIIDAVAQGFASNISATFNAMIQAFVIFKTVTNDCAFMTQCCVFVVGIMCTMNAVFAALAVLVEADGRRVQNTTCVEQGIERVCTTTTSQHRWFDQSQGHVFILQSCLILFEPVLQGLGVLLCYCTYQAYPMELFGDTANEEDPLQRQQMGGRNFGGGPVGAGGGYNGPGAGAGGRGYHGTGGNYDGSGARMAPHGGFPPTQPVPFAGQGQRLGGT